MSKKTKTLKNQLPLLPGELERDVGIDAAARGAGPDWIQQAEACVSAVAKRKEKLTTDEVWAEIGKRVGKGLMTAVGERRALGAVMRNCANMGIISATPYFKQSVRASCHRRPLRIWKSLIF